MFKKIFKGKKKNGNSTSTKNGDGGTGTIGNGGGDSVGSSKSSRKKKMNKHKQTDSGGGGVNAKENPATAALNALQNYDDDDAAEAAMGQSWASSLSGGSSTHHNTTDDESHHGGGGGGGGGGRAQMNGGHHRAASLPVLPPPGPPGKTSSIGSNHSQHNPASSSGGSTSSLKKASLRRTTSLNCDGGKSMIHSASAIGLDQYIEDRREVGTLSQNVVHLEVPFGKPIEEVYDGVHNGPVLGSGISGMVRLATHKATGIKYAVKVLDLSLVESPDGLEQLREEIYIMCQLDHPNIVRLEEVYESHSEIYLVQELCLGGELFDRLDEQPDYHYTEAECARLVKQMLAAVRYLHLRGIIHRDLKLENFLFSSVHPDSELKMIDFGLSKHFKYGEVHHEAVGTPYTVAPEVIRGSYDERCDIWAIGVIAFLLLSGDPPFGGCGGPEPLMTVRSNILKGDFAFEPEDIWANVSQSARKFIRALLVTDPKKRPTAEQAWNHQWLTYWSMRGKTESDQVLNPNVVKALVNFKEFSDMRKLLCEVLSFTLLPEQIRDLRLEFEKMDTDGSGEISLAALKQVLMTNAVAGSLGALTEEEVTDIFNAMRVRKTETRIHWHEFIAAGLSQCSVDDRNLRLAFDRLDSDHKGYITLDDIMDLMGSDALQSEDAMRRMWGDSMKAVKCQNARITYDDFLLLMKGQTKEHPGGRSHSPAHAIPLDVPLVPSIVPTTTMLHVVPEGKHPPEVIRGDPPVRVLKHQGSGSLEGSKTLPVPGSPAFPKFSDNLESPLSMDDGDDLAFGGTQPGTPGRIASLTPPSSPVRGASDYVTPRSGRHTVEFISSQSDGIELPGLDLMSDGSKSPSYLGRGALTRKRSVSLDETNKDRDDSEGKDTSSNKEPGSAEDLHAVADIVRDMMLPESGHIHMSPAFGVESKGGLAANRKLYRAHRQMRLAVLEASKRFEEQQAQHAKEVLIARQAMEGGAGSAGLVMRHGYTKQVSSDAIRQLLSENAARQQEIVAVASRKGGRGKRTRKKTISDIRVMLNAIETDDTGASSPTSADPPQLAPAQSSPIVLPDTSAKKLETEGPSRSATVPGEFRTTADPFSRKGRYGAIAYPT